MSFNRDFPVLCVIERERDNLYVIHYVLTMVHIQIIEDFGVIGTHVT